MPMENSFSAFLRNDIIAKLTAADFDILIIGGGITGAGIALDAASRGLKVALVEKDDFAYGTSSRSTKLIHGGLRYLKQLEFGLVKEVGSERAVVHKLAPHLVLPEKMLLPLYEKRGMGYWLTSIGLRLYDFLAGVKAEDQRKMLTRLQTIKHEPLLLEDDIKGGAIYAEYRTDDARLTLEIIKKAHASGACILSYCRVNDFIYVDNKLTGIKAEDVLTGKSLEVKSKVIVNAAGPWVDELRDLNKSKQGKRLHLTKGVHIVVSRAKFPVRQAIYFDVEDGRMIFAIPRGRATYIGTTDTNYSDEKDHVVITNDDAQYLVKAVNSMFPTVGLKLTDIESGWAGLRPLIHEEGKSASELSRKDEIFESPTGLISIAGGKLTGYRKMAERVVDLVIEKHFDDRELKNCFTHTILLSDLANAKEVDLYIQQLEKKLKERGIEPFNATYLAHNYGTQANEILALIPQHEDAETGLAKAEVNFCIHHEMTLTPLDFFVRRTGMMYFNIHRMEKIKDVILQQFSEIMKWSDAESIRHERALNDMLTESKKFNH